MTDTNPSDINVDVTEWTDLMTTYADMVSVDGWVQNIGPGNLRVSFRGTNAAPAGGGLLLKPGDLTLGNAAHCWCRAVGRKTAVSCGLV